MNTGAYGWYNDCTPFIIGFIEAILQFGFSIGMKQKIKFPIYQNCY